MLPAAGLGQLLREAGHPPADFWRWTACGAVAAWFALVAVVARIKGARPGWIAGRSLASVAAALAPAPAMPGTARV